MSHLGNLLSAHVDGELDGAERDKVSAHLARCEQCRTEAAELRALKRQIGELAAEVRGEADMLQRLLEIADPATPTAGRATQARRHRVLSRAAGRPVTPAGLAAQAGPATTAGRAIKAGLAAQTGPRGSRRPRLTRPRLTRRRRYAVLGAVSIVVSLGTAAFSVGGDPAPPGPKIVPQVELFSEEHAITSGEVPFGGPGPSMGTALSTARTGTAGTSTASPAARQP
jgi:anti-sigma factor RsiW